MLWCMLRGPTCLVCYTHLLVWHRQVENYVQLPKSLLACTRTCTSLACCRRPVCGAAHKCGLCQCCWGRQVCLSHGLGLKRSCNSERRRRPAHVLLFRWKTQKCRQQPQTHPNLWGQNHHHLPSRCFRQIHEQWMRCRKHCLLGCCGSHTRSMRM